MKELFIALLLVLVLNIIAITIYVGYFHPEYRRYLSVNGITGVLKTSYLGKIEQADKSALAGQLKDMPFISQIIKNYIPEKKKGSSIEDLIAAASNGKASDYAPDKKNSTLLDSFIPDEKRQK